MDYPCTNPLNRKVNRLTLVLESMKEERTQYVTCAHCEAPVRLEEAVDYQHNLVYGKHYHCRDCDPDGVWDCVSHHVDLDVH